MNKWIELLMNLRKLIAAMAINGQTVAGYVADTRKSVTDKLEGANNRLSSLNSKVTSQKQARDSKIEEAQAAFDTAVTAANAQFEKATSDLMPQIENATAEVTKFQSALSSL